MSAQGKIRLGVNIDHVATVRNARGGVHPDPVRAAQMAKAAGADGITAHLREDRRHIRDGDMVRLRSEVGLPLNFEMAATDEMIAMALDLRPHACCLVPERREERTTEGGLDAAGLAEDLRLRIAALKAAGIRVSLFIAAETRQIEAARALGAEVVELHTGAWCEHRLAGGDIAADSEFRRLTQGARHAAALGLEVHAGHGLDYETAEMIAGLPQVAELNIGHFLIGEAVFEGLDAVVRRMRAAIAKGQARALGQVA
ncbi:MAG: pyridoxine 5'-phosphate synthase [Pseudomonadota bacterium]